MFQKLSRKAKGVIYTLCYLCFNYIFLSFITPSCSFKHQRTIKSYSFKHQCTFIPKWLSNSFERNEFTFLEKTEGVNYTLGYLCFKNFMEKPRVLFTPLAIYVSTTFSYLLLNPLVASNSNAQLDHISLNFNAHLYQNDSQIASSVMNFSTILFQYDMWCCQMCK